MITCISAFKRQTSSGYWQRYCSESLRLLSVYLWQCQPMMRWEEERLPLQALPRYDNGIKTSQIDIPVKQ